MFFRYFLKITFNGSSFCGWQTQLNAVTVQEKTQQAISLFSSLIGDTIGCGRTDTGVHASEFYLHFDTETAIADFDYFIFKVNRVLPESIVAQALYLVNNKAHARFDAISRQYKYYILRTANPFIANAWYNVQPLNLALMQEAADCLKTHSDFSAFSKSNTQVFTNNCEVFEAYWEQIGDQLVFTISANRFLRNMVRAIVGTLLMVGQEKITVEQFNQIIVSKKRSNAGLSVPAKGLFLNKVIYPAGYFEQHTQI